MAKNDTEIIQKHLYNGECVLNFYVKAHYYKKDGKFVTSVTAITGIIDKSRVLIQWAMNLAKDYLVDFMENYTALQQKNSAGGVVEFVKKSDILTAFDQALQQHTIYKKDAADVGSAIHDLIERYVQAKINKEKFEITEELDQRIINGFNAFLGWEKQQDIEYLEVERLVYSRRFNYVGLTDCIAKINGKLFLLDWKTGKDIYAEMLYQISAYAMAYTEEMGVEVEGLMIAHFHKDTGDFSIKEISLDDYKNFKKVFIACLIVQQETKVQEKLRSLNY